VSLPLFGFVFVAGRPVRVVGALCARPRGWKMHTAAVDPFGLYLTLPRRTNRMILLAHSPAIFFSKKIVFFSVESPSHIIL
jgi:hypothetical protein